MRKSFLIARSNMRKAKGQTAAIVVLVFIAALLFNLWLMISMDYHANFDRYHNKLNAEHVTLAVTGKTDEVREFLSQKLDGDERVSQYRLDDCLNMAGLFPFNDGQINTWLVFTEKSVSLTRSIGKAEIVEDGNISSGIYMPMLYKSDAVKIGKPLEMSVGSHAVEFDVCGFFNSVMMGSNNCTMMQVILTEDKYDELDALGYAPKATLCSIRLKDKSDSLNFEADVKSAVSKQFPNIMMNSNSYAIVSQSRYIAQGICSVIIMVMAFLVLLISVVVIVSNIVNYIQTNMKNLGALKSVGYTSRRLVLSLLVQFSGLTLIAAIAGTATSYALFPAVNSMMIAQTGIPYAIRFLPLPALISLLILVGAVVLAVWLSARKIKKIEPIVALRSGITTHSFKRNHIPLERTKAPLNFALALKTTLSGIKHNITVCITMLVLTLVVVFSGLMTENVVVDMTPFIDLIMGESADSCINVETVVEDDFVSAMNGDGRVEKVYLYNSLNMSHVGGAQLMATLCDDFSKVNNQSVVFKGRFPKYENELAIAAKYAKEKGFKVGDEIEITANGNTQKYLISGFTQITNYLGRDCLMTRQGYERLGKLEDVTYYLNIANGVDIDEFNAEIKQRFEGHTYIAVNIKSAIDGASTVYITLITAIVVAILVLSAIIIAFVLYLLVRTMLNNKKRDYGILKSLGFTTKQLVLQTAMSFMPAVIISVAIGIIASCFAINPLMSAFLSGMGIVKCTFTVPVLFSSVAGVGLILVSFGLACLLSLKVKRIAPRAILVGE